MSYLVFSFFEGKSYLTQALLYLAGGYSVYYFISLIIQFYLLLPWLQKIVDKYKKRGLIGSLIFSMISLSLFHMMAFQWGISLPLIIYAGAFPYWLIFFVLGLYFGKGYDLKISRLFLLFLIVIGIISMYIETVYLYEQYKVVDCVGNRKFSWLFYSVSITILVFSMKNIYHSNFINHFISKVGDYSFGIYLIHMYVLSFCVNKIFIDLNWLLRVPLVLFLSMLIIYVCRRVFPNISKKIGV